MSSEPKITGRDSEMARLAAFAESLADRPSAVVLDGEAGIGKTTLWSAGLALARAHGSTILRAQPAESEADVPYAVLGDLIRFVPEAVFNELPKPQRNALRIVALLDDPAVAPVDARTVV